MRSVAHPTAVRPVVSSPRSAGRNPRRASRRTCAVTSRASASVVASGAARTSARIRVVAASRAMRSAGSGAARCSASQISIAPSTSGASSHCAEVERLLPDRYVDAIGQLADGVAVACAACREVVPRNRLPDQREPLGAEDLLLAEDQPHRDDRKGTADQRGRAERNARRTGLERRDRRLAVRDPLGKEPDRIARRECRVHRVEHRRVARQLARIIAGAVDRNGSPKLHQPRRLRVIPQRCLREEAHRPPRRRQHHHRIEQRIGVIGHQQHRPLARDRDAGDLQAVEGGGEEGGEDAESLVVSRWSLGS